MHEVDCLAHDRTNQGRLRLRRPHSRCAAIRDGNLRRRPRWEAVRCQESSSTVSNDEVVPTIVLGGNGMNMYSSITSMPQMLPTSLSAQVFSISFPGAQYGNEGWTNPSRSLSEAKMLLAHVWKTTGKRSVVFGWSLGSSLAAGLAAESADQVSCVVLGNPFTNMRAEVLAITAYLTYPWLYLFDEWPTEKWARAVRAPTILLSSKNDEVIPDKMHRAVYTALGATTKHLIERDASHMSFSPFQRELQDTLSQWCSHAGRLRL